MNNSYFFYRCCVFWIASDDDDDDVRTQKFDKHIFDQRFTNNANKFENRSNDSAERYDMWWRITIWMDLYELQFVKS